jgi:hypothetical protein
MNTTVNGALGDLDGDMDGGAAEAAVLNVAVNCWDARITTNRNFTLTVQTMPLMNARGTGATTTVTAGIPTAGRITMEDGTNVNWFVDATPLGSLEFTPDPNAQWRFINGTGAAAQADLLRAVMHEIGHAQGWICGNAACNRATDNFNFDGLMVPQPANFMANVNVSIQANPGFNVPLRGDGLPVPQVNELSHVGPFGPFDAVPDLMYGRTNNGRRETPSMNNVDMFARAYTDSVNFPLTVNAGADITAECNAVGGANVTLDGSGSTDPEMDALTYSWTCQTVPLSSANTAMPSGFFALNQTETCRLAATDLAACPTDDDLVDVTVVDTTDPMITCPADDVIECDESTDPSNTGTATADDVCDSTPVIGSSDVVTPGACPQESTITRTWTATDDDSNSMSCDQTIEVVDTTDPVISCNSPNKITPPDAPISFTATAVDNCDSVPDVEILGYDCFKVHKDGKITSKLRSCAVEIDGPTITILDSGGVGDNITWVVSSTDDCGNTVENLCALEVVRPGQP